MSQQVEQKVDRGLREGVMSGPELAAQALASIAPSAVIAFTAAAIFLGAGNGTMFAFFLATIVILCVGYIVTVFARKHPSAGSLYTYVARGLGPTGTIWLVVLTIVIGGLATFFTIRGIRISARVSLVLELISIAIILILLVSSLVWLGPEAWDPSQFSFEGVPFQGVAAGMVLGILGFVGFSSADALGREARNPRTAIPRAIMWSAVVVGVLYVFAAYTQIAVLGDELGEVASPLQAINDRIGMPGWFAPILVFGVAASFFAVVVAPLNVVGRIVYVMGKEGIVPERFGRTHESHLTPHRVLLVAGPAAIVLDVILLLAGTHPMDIVVWVDTYGTYGYMVAYALVAIAGIIYTKREGMKNTLVWICAVVAVVAMAWVFFANVWPVPAFPLNLIPYIFIATMLAAFIRFWWIKANRPEVLDRVGKTHIEEMSGIG